MTLRRGTTIMLGLLVAACGLTGVHAVRPAGSTQGDTAEPVTIASAESETVGAIRAPLDLTKFRPLLADRRYGAVRALVDDEKPAEAAKALAAIIEEDRPEAVVRAREHYLLGILLRDAGDRSAALAAFQAASLHDWILKDDAQLSVAELAVDGGSYDQALLAVDALTTLKDSPRAWGIRAAALVGKKEYRKAVDAWTTLLTKEEGAAARVELARCLLELAEAEPPGESRQKLAIEAAETAERARLGRTPEDEISSQVELLLTRAAASGAPAKMERTLEQQIAHLRVLVAELKFDAAEEAVKELSLPVSPRYSSERCEADHLVGKVHAGQRRWGEGADLISGSAEHCTADPEMHAWLLFNAGKYSAADGRHTKAIYFYAELERLYPDNSLADDARLRAARSYERQGVTARFVSLLASMPDDYPKGDMTMEGVLTLALYRIERNDWAGAAVVLERAARVIRKEDSSRGHEHAGTERYFLARAQQELGEDEAALKEFESIVREVPLSYYMLHAYSRLLEADPKRAQAALAEGLSLAQQSPFEFPHRPEYETREFRRGLELLRVSDAERGKRVLDEAGLSEEADDSLLWGMALLYDRAGDAHTSHGIARGRLTDWFAHYPEGAWAGPWQIGFPRPYHSIVEHEAKATGVPEWFIYGVMREESTFRPRVVSHADAYGLMQVIVPTARGIAKKSGHPYSPAALKRPDVNIAIGSRVLQELGKYFRTNPWLAIPGYNAGPGRPKQWLRERPNVDFDVWVEMIPYRETRRYTKRVLASRAAYAFLYYREQSQTALVLPQRFTPP